MEKIILITGGGRGIGAACALLAARQGYVVCISYVADEAAAAAVVAAIERAGGAALSVQADVSDESAVERLFVAVDKRFGRLNALINNAGILSAQMRVEQMDATRINRILTTNVTGSFLCAREAVRRMSTRHGGSGGSIVNMSSRGAVLGSPGEYVDYAASKAALDALTIGLSKEVAGENIRVNGVRPGLIHTDIHASGGEPGRVSRLQSSVPMARGGEPIEVAKAALWLLSDEASYTTGSFIDVSGGR
ncbi:SDR family oxidoreductase [Rhodoferax sp.]|uniref:SDR family oxidoreductase n=1 Tax=Rhodoferax sp. TaxID=50421 RepID=UPI0008AFE72A|nr:SDR family oxidoreductase [Rhodoferax sp.]MDO8320908.1 SDR family oxidoreductase [Rhodoferax sp.]MDP2677797.1 SDR family oxidoreductase [Rhodoferax sp.]OGB51731.1 MAG: NAD(P)-dependent oxidoreductase [Burkholderiales bacterium RIFOXYD12_FULL_59_19]